MDNKKSNLTSLIQEIKTGPYSEQEKENFISLLEKLYSLRPPAEVDDDFKEQLRYKLKQTAEISMSSINKKNMNTKKYTYIMQIFSWTAASTAVLAVVLLGGIYFLSGQKSISDEIAFSSQPQITTLDKQAFGSLLASGSQNSAQATGLGAGQGEGFMPVAEPVSLEAKQSDRQMIGGGGGEAAIMPAFRNYSFVYQGDDFPLTDTEIEVFRRVKGEVNKSAVNNILRSVDLGLLDLKRFSSVKLENISLLEDRPYGYALHINFNDGNIFLSENWSKWPNPAADCRDEKCFQQFQMKISDMPEDEIVVELAQKFLTEYGIDLSAYGQPEVQNQWRQTYIQAENKSTVYIPEVVTVVYPLVFDNQSVFDEGGNKNGLYVNVNIRAKKVSGLWNLTSQIYEKSAYQAVTDYQKVITLAEQGGWRHWWGGQQPGVEQIEVSLGTPSRGYVRVWNYNPSQPQGNELYVPALVFPVINVPDELNFYQENVIVPLAEELLNQDNQPYPMPLLIEPDIMESSIQSENTQ